MVLSLSHSPAIISQKYSYQLSGISDRPMGAYLAGLGLMRIIERHVDKTAQFYWQGLDFWIDTNVPQSELVDRILATYEAMVAFNPWNKSSGIEMNTKTGELNYVGSIAKIADSESWRTQAIRDLLPEFKELIDEFKVGETTFSYPEKLEKLKFIEQCLSRISNTEWREWADATIILMQVTNKDGATSIKPKYPALLGSGGNVGAVDIAENYYSAVAILFDPQTGEPAANAAACLTKAIFGIDSVEVTESKEVKALHLFPRQDYKLDFALSKNNDYAPSGGSSATTVNPALMLLASEGLSTFSGQTSTINGGGDSDTGKAIGRTLARYSLAVATNGASTDLVSLDERKSFTEEYFLPLWSEPRTYKRLKKNLFESPLANEEQFYLPRQINDGTDFIQALQEWAVKNKIAGKFARYAMLPRKGQSNFAVMLEVVNVGAEAKKLDLAADLDEYRRNIRFFAKSDNCPTLLQGSIYQFDRVFNQFIQGKCSHTALLMALSKLAPVRHPKSLRFDWIEPLQAESNCPEFRLALSIASCGLKSYLYGEGATFAVGNLIDSLVRLQRQWGFAADKDRSFYFYPTEQRIFATFSDISTFISNPNFDDRLFESWLWVLSLIDFNAMNTMIDSPRENPNDRLAILKLPSAYRIGVVHLKTFSRKNSPVAAISSTGDLKSTISHLMGAGIHVRAHSTQQVLVSDVRSAAALAFPVSSAQTNKIIEKFFTKESDSFVGSTA
jgi:CRISPR-associated protein Csx17